MSRARAQAEAHGDPATPYPPVGDHQQENTGATPIVRANPQPTEEEWATPRGDGNPDDPEHPLEQEPTTSPNRSGAVAIANPDRSGQPAADTEANPQLWTALESIQAQLASLAARVNADEQAQDQAFDQTPINYPLTGPRGQETPIRNFVDEISDNSEEVPVTPRTPATQPNRPRIRRTSARRSALSYYTNQRTPRRHVTPGEKDKTYQDSSSENDYRDTAYATGHHESSHDATVLPFHARPIGPPHVGLRSIKPANSLFDKLMSYRSYRLKRTIDVRSLFDTTEVRTHLKNLTLTLKSLAFDGDDPIMIFDFLTRFVNEADMLNMSEAQAFVARPAFLKSDAEDQFKENLSGAASLGGVTC